MALSFRKSKTVGLLRFTLSKRGVGASVGGRRARVGVSADGDQYASASGGGFVARRRLGRGGVRAGFVLAIVAVVALLALIGHLAR